MVKHKEFAKLYPGREFALDSEHFLSMFDLHLILYRSIKDELETKLNFNIYLSELKEQGLLKNYKYPFFNFKDNRNSHNKIEKKLEEDSTLYEEITYNDHELYMVYKNYLPRANALMMLKRFPDIDQYFQMNKQAVNQINKLTLDPLISESENLDWFIYDDESLNFLIDAEKIDSTVEQTVKYSPNNESVIYFQDKYPYMLLTTRDIENFIIELSLRNVILFI